MSTHKIHFLLRNMKNIYLDTPHIKSYSIWNLNKDKTEIERFTILELLRSVSKKIKQRKKYFLHQKLHHL